MAQNVREAAFSVLRALEKKSAWSDLQLKSEIEKNALDKRDAALLTNLVYRVLENRALLDFYIEHYTGRALKKLSPALLDILRLSVCQIVFFDKIPAHAAVAQGVELAKKKANPHAAGLVNAVLRRISAEKDRLPEVPGRGTSAYLSVKYSHALWFVEAMLPALGYDGTEALLRANGETPPVVCRVNSLKASREAVLAALADEGVSATPHGALANAVILEKAGDIRSLRAFREGLFYVQDTASQLAVAALSPAPYETGIDLCAAPGGKSMLCAQYMENKGVLYAFDIHSHRVELIRQNARRMGISILSAGVKDAAVFDESLAGRADFVLCDVPCTGTGVIRKKPEIRFKGREGLHALHEIQGKILKNAGTYLKAGGKMLYLTCSLLKEENENIVNRFLSLRPDCRLLPFHLPGIGRVESGMLTLYPHLHGTDGFFIANIGRVGHE